MFVFSLLCFVFRFCLFACLFLCFVLLCLFACAGVCLFFNDKSYGNCIHGGFLFVLETFHSEKLPMRQWVM